MKIGKFDKRITIKRPVTERTDTGGIKTSSLTTLFTTWAKMEPVEGRRRIDMARVGYNDTYDVMLRARENYTIKTSDVLIYNSTEYQIDSITQTPDKRYLKLEVNK
jgi:SPP1 family predicted phage head-tail adaptor